MTPRVIVDPVDGELLNLSYLATCLRRAGRLTDDGELAGFELERLGSDNSKLYRIKLIAAAPDGRLPASLLLKTCAGTFGRSEVDYYTKDYADSDSPPMPRCYDAAFDGNAYHLLLDDLTATHRNQWDVPPTRTYGEAAAKAVAALHAHRWGVERIRSAGYPEPDASAIDRYVAYMDQGRGPLLDALREEGLSELAAVAARVFDFLPGAMTRRMSLSRDALTLVHGDLNPGNILSPKEATSGTDGRGVVLIDRQPFDWSLTSWVGPSDLSYMTVLWWEPEARRRLEGTVLETYERELARRGAAIESRERLWLDYRLSAMQCFYVAASWCIDAEERTRMRWLWMSELERAAAAYRDLRCEELLA